MLFRSSLPVLAALFLATAPAAAQERLGPPTGSVRIQQVQVAFIGSGEAGEGTLRLGRRSYPITVGGLGIGRFYIGDTKTGVWQIVVTVLTCGIGALWGLIDGILMLVNDNVTDAQGRPLRSS